MYEIIGNKPCRTQATKKSVSSIHNCGYILVFFPYDKDMVSKVKAVKSAKYLPGRKCWRVENITKAIKALDGLGFPMLSLKGALRPSDREYLREKGDKNNEKIT